MRNRKGRFRPQSNYSVVRIKIRIDGAGKAAEILDRQIFRPARRVEAATANSAPYPWA